MKKILFLIDSLGGGGAERALVNLILNINQYDYKIEVKTLYNKGVYIDLIKNKVKYSTANLPQIKGINYLIKFLPSKVLHDLIIKEKYDCEIAFLEGISTKIISGGDKDVKKAAFVRIDMQAYNRADVCYISKKNQKKCYQKFDSIAFVGEDSKKSFIEKFDIHNNLSTVKNIVDTNDMICKSKEKVEINNVTYPVFLTIGRLSYQKGNDRLLSVHLRLINEGYRYTLIIIGKGEKREALKKYIEKNKLTDFTLLLDYQENPFKFIKYCDWFLSPSRYEGFSSVIREAVILGKAIIATKVSGVKEVLGENEFGVTVENNENALYCGMKKILNTPELKLYYEKKVKMIQSKFNMENTIKENLLFLDRLLDEK